MAIQEKPIGLKDYHKSMQAYYTEQIEKAEDEIANLTTELNVLYDEIKENKEVYANDYKIYIFKYKEIAQNKYIDGSLIKFAKTAYLNKKEQYKLTVELYHLLRYAKLQEKIYRLEKDIVFYNKLVSLNTKEYTEILREYYKQLHKFMILNGYGYSLGEIGWICINRCHVKKTFRKLIDFQATKRREKQLLAEGKKIYNKDEAEWCLRNGIEYHAEDKRVFKEDEYVYEVPLIDSKIPGGSDFKLELINYRGGDTKGKLYDEMLQETNNDTTKICELDIDLRTKIVLCNRADKLIYNNFIRNEHQTSINASKATREGK